MKKEWKYKDNVAVKYHWTSTGQLLATGVCVRDDYQKHFPPEDGTTKVYSTIADHEVRQVDAKKMTISLDFTLTIQWTDLRIRTSLAPSLSTLPQPMIRSITGFSSSKWPK